MALVQFFVRVPRTCCVAHSCLAFFVSFPPANLFCMTSSFVRVLLGVLPRCFISLSPSPFLHVCHPAACAYCLAYPSFYILVCTMHSYPPVSLLSCGTCGRFLSLWGRTAGHCARSATCALYSLPSSLCTALFVLAICTCVYWFFAPSVYPGCRCRFYWAAVCLSVCRPVALSCLFRTVCAVAAFVGSFFHPSVGSSLRLPALAAVAVCCGADCCLSICLSVSLSVYLSPVCPSVGRSVHRSICLSVTFVSACADCRSCLHAISSSWLCCCLPALPCGSLLFCPFASARCSLLCCTQLQRASLLCTIVTRSKARYLRDRVLFPAFLLSPAPSFPHDISVLVCFHLFPVIRSISAILETTLKCFRRGQGDGRPIGHNDQGCVPLQRGGIWVGLMPACTTLYVDGAATRLRLVCENVRRSALTTRRPD